MFKSNTVGEKEYFLERRTRDGKYLEISVAKEIKLAILVEVVVAEVHVTHVGPKGLIKFEFNGEGWICDSPSVQRADSVALNEVMTKAIYCKDLTYDRSDLEDLQDRYYAKKDHDDPWVEIPDAGYDRLPA